MGVKVDVGGGGEMGGHKIVPACTGKEGSVSGCGQSSRATHTPGTGAQKSGI